jgi:hypothetical protein
MEKSNSKRVMAYVQGHHCKKPVHTHVREKTGERIEECIQARSVWRMRGRTSESKREQQKKSSTHTYYYEEEE